MYPGSFPEAKIKFAWHFYHEYRNAFDTEEEACTVPPYQYMYCPLNNIQEQYV